MSDPRGMDMAGVMGRGWFAPGAASRTRTVLYMYTGTTGMVSWVTGVRTVRVRVLGCCTMYSWPGNHLVSRVIISVFIVYRV